ncbi:MAG: VanW family protein [bacterium]|nr:MAG: VanW family protein [bacterium]
MAKKQKPKKNIYVVSLFIFLIFSILLLITILPFNKKIYPNTYVAGIYLGDLSKEDAKKELEKVSIPEKVKLNVEGLESEVLTSEIVDAVDLDKTVSRAYNYSNSGNVFLDIRIKIGLIFKPHNLPLTINYNQSKLEETLAIITLVKETEPVTPSAKIINGQVVVEKGKNGIVADLDKTEQEIKNNLSYLNNKEIVIDLIQTNDELDQAEVLEYTSLAKKFIGSKIDLKHEFDNIILSENDLLKFVNPKGQFMEDVIILKISDISRKINRNPQNSVFIVENGKVLEFTPSKEGITVNEDELLSEITTSLDKIIDSETKSLSFGVPVVKQPAKIKNEDVNNLGINTLLGRGLSYYRGSIANRVYNINLGQSKFKGILVGPNETFSFNNIIGDISALTGYKSAYVIKDGKTVLGDGGGICQVSTTLFRAVLNAGLPIVERRAHSYRVGYYEQGFSPGLDATIYYPTTDLKFKNNTEAHLLIQPIIDTKNSSLVFEIYGTSDGRVSSVSKPIITSSVTPAEDLYVDDPSLPMGTTKQIEYRAYGARVVFDYKVTRGDETLIDQKFVSNYRPWQAVYLRGTGL